MADGGEFRSASYGLFKTLGAGGAILTGPSASWIIVVLVFVFTGYVTALCVMWSVAGMLRLAGRDSVLRPASVHSSLVIQASGSAIGLASAIAAAWSVRHSQQVDIAPGVPLTAGYPILIFIAIAILGHILLQHTRYGRYVYAIGCNERAAVYSAIHVDRIKILTYTLIGSACGVAGLLLASRMNSVSSSGTGNLYELDAIAAVVIGGTRMNGGSGTIRGTVIGVLILGVIANMLNLLNVSPYLQGLVKGAIIIAAVLMQRGSRNA